MSNPELTNQPSGNSLQMPKKLGDTDCLSSDTDTEMILHGQQPIEGLEFDDLEASAGVISSHTSPMKGRVDSSASPNGTSDSGLAGGAPAGEHAGNSSNGSFTTAGKGSPKIPTLTQVYELASNVGHAIEPLTHELGTNRLENLTKQILPVLSLLENTAQTCQDLFKKEQQLLYDNNNLKKRLKHQQEHFEHSELEYHATINQLSDQLEAVQCNLDNKSSEWDFECNPISHVEENLALALKEAQTKIEQLQVKKDNKKGKGSRERSKSRSSDNCSEKSNESGSSTAEKQKNLFELNQIIEQKNYYKERCFILEDELRELKGQRHETLLESRVNTSGSNFAQNFANFAKGESNLPKSMSTFFTRFTNGSGKGGEQ